VTETEHNVDGISGPNGIDFNSGKTAGFIEKLNRPLYSGARELLARLNSDVGIIVGTIQRKIRGKLNALDDFPEQIRWDAVRAGGFRRERPGRIAEKGYEDQQRFI
jgi:hypothetical protein